MFSSYTQKQTPAQKKDAPTASSVLDSSSQSEGLQRKADMTNNAAQREETPRPNNTGMPDNLKAGIESLSGFSMDDVRVHYNSSKPATVQALAYTQGTDIHVAPGQEKHLPHEAWHVAQQMAGRVSPTTNINGMPVNDNAALEHEADVMGEKAKSIRYTKGHMQNRKIILSSNNIQRVIKLTEALEKKHIQKICDENGSDITTSCKKSSQIDQNCKINLVEDNCDKRVDAIKRISKRAADVGNMLNKSRTENEDIPNIVNVAIPCKYKTTKQKKDVSLTMTYSMGKTDPGYIIKIERKKDNNNNEIGIMVPGSLYDSNSTKNKANRTKFKVSGDKVGTALTDIEYTNIHHDTKMKNLLLATKKKNQNGVKEAMCAEKWDAYTKLAAEGARFSCVRNNIDKINDDTVIWDDDLKCGVYFSDLWKTWAWSFNKKYNISDNDIHNAFLEKEIQQGEEVRIKNNTTVNDKKVSDDILRDYFVDYGNFINKDGWIPAHYSGNAKIAKGCLVIQKNCGKKVNGISYLNSISLTKKINSRPTTNVIDLVVGIKGAAKAGAIGALIGAGVGIVSGVGVGLLTNAGIGVIARAGVGAAVVGAIVGVASWLYNK